MGFLASAERLIASPYEGQFVPVKLIRQDEGGVVFISCEELPEMFVAVKSEEEVYWALDSSLKSAFSKEGRRVQVYTNGKISGPTINAAVYVSKHR